MYPLDAVLVGCRDEILPALRRELVKLHVHVQGEHTSVGQLLANTASEGEWTGAESKDRKPHLIIQHLKSPRDIQEIRRLSNTFTGQPILAILEPGCEQAFLISVMREGASQVVVLPLQADDFKTALDRIGAQYGHTVSDCLAIAVTGVTGGCGATTIALNLAYEIAHLFDVNCILIELSLQMGVLPGYLNIAPTFTIQDLLKDIDRMGGYEMQKSLTAITDRLKVLTGPHENIGAQTASPRQVMQIIEFARRLADVIILDVPGSYDDLFFHSLAAGDEVVLIGEQKVPSVRALSLLTRTLAKEAGIAAPHLVINRYDPKVPGFAVADIERVLGASQVLTVANDYASVSGAVNQGKPLRLAAPRSRALADIDKLAQSFTHLEEPAAQVRGHSMFGKLVKAFGL